MGFIDIQDNSAYIRASKFGDQIWNIVIQWQYFEKKTIGDQLVRAVDSISANLAEGFGRYYKKDKIKFYHNSRASVIECKDWLNKCKRRNLLDKMKHGELMDLLNTLPMEINHLIKFTDGKLSR
ncbi:four helix bundle protein [Candidatus Dojkabacteria bacterium]|nr:four helix bundle protein [Candidatus Dojkabacteria bacterium]